ncbi:hypothetical protein KDW_63510 [Dictyobacter vulcani]|uniref:Uncharacterized protein n=1 Tax=Dictyobacter vulcani TaxID=2607529 RepID=A0A5J4L1L5_9CHLR|nr:alpha-glucosidase C-terminal domain-containing protein [Dictyobacter vulcani]GER92189.1 hypothetical protein KDW_63510 [Dictyobacter vulcani]
MQDVHVPLEMMHDPQGKDNPLHSRDPQRSPMQWNNEDSAGFCAPGVVPWLPLAEDYQQCNVEVEQKEEHSHLLAVRTLLSLRRSIPALNIGTYESIELNSKECFGYVREHEGKRYLIVLNFSDQEQSLSLPFKEGVVVFSTHLNHTGSIELADFVLPGNEGYVFEIV